MKILKREIFIGEEITIKGIKYTCILCLLTKYAILKPI